MAKIKLNEEIICALQKCKDAKEIMALAKSKGVEMNGGQAGEIFEMFQNDKLSDEDLEKVVGGQTSSGNVMDFQLLRLLIELLFKDIHAENDGVIN